MARAISNVKATRLFVEQLQKENQRLADENAELRATLFSVLDYAGGWAACGMDEKHPLRAGWMLRHKLEGRMFERVNEATTALRATGKWSAEEN